MFNWTYGDGFERRYYTSKVVGDPNRTFADHRLGGADDIQVAAKDAAVRGVDFYLNTTVWAIFFGHKKNASTPSLFDMVFEFDAGPEDSLRSSRILVTHLRSLGLDESQVNVFFSGNKGHHIVVPAVVGGQSPRADQDAVAKRVAKRILHDCGLELGYDKSDGMADESMFRKQACRAANSIHTGSRLYKVYLTHDELFTLSFADHRRLGEKPRSQKPAAPTLSPLLCQLWQAAVEKTDAAKNEKKAPMPTQMETPPACIQHLIDGGDSQPSVGRHELVWRLATWFRQYSGLTIEQAIDTVLSFSIPTNNPNKAEDETRGDVASIYGSEIPFTPRACSIFESAGLPCSRNECPVFGVRSCSNALTSVPALVLDLTPMDQVQQRIETETLKAASNREKLLLRVTAGAGKTFGAMKTLVEKTDLHILYLAPNHDLIKNHFETEEWVEGFTHYQGRSAQNCAEFLRMSRYYANRDVKAATTFCQHICPQRSGCEQRGKFKSTFKLFTVDTDNSTTKIAGDAKQLTMSEWDAQLKADAPEAQKRRLVAAPVQMLPTLAAEGALAGFDVIVVDEDPSAVFLDHLKIDRVRMNQVLSQWRTIAKEKSVGQKEVDINGLGFTALGAFLFALSACLRRAAGEKGNWIATLREELGNAGRNLEETLSEVETVVGRANDSDALPDDWESDEDPAVFDVDACMVTSDGLAIVPFGLISDENVSVDRRNRSARLAPLGQAFNFLPDTVASIRHDLVPATTHRTAIRVDFETRRRTLHIHRLVNIKPEHFAGKALIMLDATAGADFMEHLVPGLKTVRIDVPQQGQLSQVVESKWSRARLKKEKPADIQRLVECCSWFFQGSAKPLVITYKFAVEGALGDALRAAIPGLGFIHFGKERGFNLKTDAVAVIGWNQPNEKALEDEIGALFEGKEINFGVTKRLVRYGTADNGQDKAIWVNQYDDSRLEAWRWQRGDASVVQAIQRARLVRPDKDNKLTKALLLSDRPLGGELRVNRLVVSIADLVPTVARRGRPASPGERAWGRLVSTHLEHLGAVGENSLKHDAFSRTLFRVRGGCKINKKLLTKCLNQWGPNNPYKSNRSKKPILEGYLDPIKSQDEGGAMGELEGVWVECAKHPVPSETTLQRWVANYAEEHRVDRFGVVKVNEVGIQSGRESFMGDREAAKLFYALDNKVPAECLRIIENSNIQPKGEM